ncbi:MAG TPA: carboxypeptidase regulatory-like domain-containing protein [Terracidiphilus sp.]|nr:carboxypeptidase regulatory-like domain-containing protein [Terracidiphilus sp.]
MASIAAHGQSTPQDAASKATIHGHIADQTGALIPGAKVTVTSASGKIAATATADASGAYSVSGLAAGSYIVSATFSGFADFTSQPIAVTAGQIKRVDIAMAIEVAQQSVVVTDESPTVNVEAAGNANSVVLKDKDLDALSDDPDELSSELSALAGPSAGPNGGQIYIDGFTGGQLPPKSAIREIRINQNPFSAEFDRLGYGRIEILTKPGTDKLHGQFFIQGNDSAFNTGNPFTPNIPPYNRIQYNGTINGALSHNASFFLSVEQRDNHDVQVYNYFPAVYDSASNTYSLSTSRVSGTQSNPHNHINVTPRIDLQLGQKDTVTLRYQFYYDSESGDITSQQLPTQSMDSRSTEHTIQLSESHIINDHTVNETRLEYRRQINKDTPVNTDPTLIVSGNFTGGGATGQFSTDHQDHFELQNYTTMSLGRHALKFGAWLRDNRDATSAYSNHNGTLVFNDAGYIKALNTLAAGGNLNSIGTGSATSAGLTSLTITAGQTDYKANVLDGALFVQDDWKVNPRLTLSGGLRWEAQNHIADHNDWAPRVAMAYALDAKGNKPAKTVLRAGFGMFYDRFNINNVMTATRQSVTSNQVQVTTNSPSCLNGTSLTSVDFSGCLPATLEPNSQSTVVQISPTFHAPYSEQIGASIERQLTKTTTFTGTYLHTFGVHQLVTRNANAYLPGEYVVGAETQPANRPNPTLGIINEFYPEAVYKQNQMILNVNARISPKFSLMGFYNLSFANTDGAGGYASNAYNLSQDYGRASFVARNMLFLMGNYTAPWGVRLNPFLIANSGRPFNIISPYDLTGDNYLNSRPSEVDASNCTAGSTQFYSTSFGCLNTLPAANETLLPMNLGTGPTAVAFNLRVSKAIGIGPKIESAGRPNTGQGGPGGGGPPPGGGRGGPGGGGPGGGLGPGGLGGGGMRGGGGMFGGSSSGSKYTLNFSAQALNLFNNINYGTPGGTVGSPNFGQSTSLAGRPFSSGAAVRSIFLQAVFSF